MIIVKNRELLIPNNERYIGTTYDNETENRVFQVPRFSQRGVDLAALTFRLDIQYANEAFDTVLLDKEVGEAFIILIWRITSSTLQVPGTMYIGLRAIDDEAAVKWSSFSAAMYAERHLNTPGNYGGSLTEIEQIEQDHVYMKSVVDELKSNLDYAHDAEAWAQGTRSGEAVPSTDKTYHKNSKYYSEQANTKATQAANSATAAANSATQAAETVSDTNTRFNNAMAAVTVNTEVQDARVGADGTTYTVLKNRLDAEHTDVKTAIDKIITIGTQLFDKDNAETEHWLPANNTVAASVDSTSVIIPVNPSASDTHITVHRETISSRFTVSTFTAKPGIGSAAVTQVNNNGASAITVPCTTAIKYLLVLIHNSNYDTGITVATMLDGLMVQYGSSYTGYEPYSYGVIIPDKSVSGSSFSDNGIEFISDLIADQTENEKAFIKANSADNLTTSAVTLSWTEGSYYDLTNGSITTLSGRSHTDKIDCKAGDRISVTNNSGQILFWDKRNALLKYVATSRNSTVTAVVPTNAVKYAFNNDNSAIRATDVTQYINTTATEKHGRIAPAKLIYDYTSFQNGKYCSTNGGKITNVNNFYCLPFIPVEQNHKYRTQTQTQIVYYDANLEFMSAMLPGGEANNTGATVEMDFTTPVGCAYVSINSRSSHEMVFDLDYTVAGFINNPQKLQGKSVVCFGDSITGNYAFGDNYPYEIEKFTGAKTYNCGFGGCRMELINTDTAHTNPFSMCGIVDALESGDWTEQDAYAMSISRLVYFRLQILKSIDWDNVDIVTIAYGTNEGGYPQDDPENKYNKYTYAGATRYAVEKLLTLYPKLRIVLLTPIYRYHTAEQQDSDSWTHPIYGGKLTDNVATLISVGKELKLPVLDLYHTLGINITNCLSYFGDDDEQQDGTHINSFGREQMGRRVAGELSRLF